MTQSTTLPLQELALAMLESSSWYSLISFVSLARPWRAGDAKRELEAHRVVLRFGEKGLVEATGFMMRETRFVLHSFERAEPAWQLLPAIRACGQAKDAAAVDALLRMLGDSSFTAHECEVVQRLLSLLSVKREVGAESVEMWAHVGHLHHEAPAPAIVLFTSRRELCLLGAFIAGPHRTMGGLYVSHGVFTDFSLAPYEPHQPDNQGGSVDETLFAAMRKTLPMHYYCPVLNVQVNNGSWHDSGVITVINMNNDNNILVIFAFGIFLGFVNHADGKFTFRYWSTSRPDPPEKHPFPSCDKNCVKCQSFVAWFAARFVFRVLEPQRDARLDAWYDRPAFLNTCGIISALHIDRIALMSDAMARHIENERTAKTRSERETRARHIRRMFSLVREKSISLPFS